MFQSLSLLNQRVMFCHHNCSMLECQSTFDLHSSYVFSKSLCVISFQKMADDFSNRILNQHVDMSHTIVGLTSCLTCVRLYFTYLFTKKLVLKFKNVKIQIKTIKDSKIILSP